MASDPLDLELETIVHCYVGIENGTQVFGSTEPSLQPTHCFQSEESEGGP